ncbi:bifunctional methylenetetrahydrofolate dehydrogenase/methenyltetrahydrofolate cyclohydrolase [Caldisericum exile]|uniref:Bifunctional protein FolD n=1 Tax=Caldisericum exile (strain DSM 21853 / NBRC 104410 / AZM16c01) TaxID=511051 RepID=A0A7U6GE17_CALEA|nr:bifunctional methylenetetrahydrofolate dehydrogenase/methenyltetrahydrofolate cyclohydrolase [Caldisericum exile]BAL80679.1 methylenetetrahydrofolate dehydrogenase/methenyltetrahydrofolate cyclohydrolase [Caldisericum exile AZM16c01]
MILDGKEIALRLQNEIKTNVEELKKRLINPALAVIQVGEEKASESYAKNIRREGENLGIYVEHHKLASDISEEELLYNIKNLNLRKDIHGILIELPLPQQINKTKVIETISPEKDVDGFHPINFGKLFEGTTPFQPATAQAILTAIKSVVSIEGKHAVVIGRSNIVGKPTAALLLQENATVTICHSKTRNLKDITNLADILVVSVGKPKLIDRNYVKPGAVVIDAGINKIDGKLVGDVDFDSVKAIASYITPVPGGIGVLTTLMLFRNTVKAANLQSKII